MRHRSDPLKETRAPYDELFRYLRDHPDWNVYLHDLEDRWHHHWVADDADGTLWQVTYVAHCFPYHPDDPRRGYRLIPGGIYVETVEFVTPISMACLGPDPATPKAALELIKTKSPAKAREDV